MKTLLFSLLFFSTSLAFAQPKRSTIQFRLNDNSLIRLAMNGRYFPNTARVLTVGDIPGKKQYVEVYRVLPYSGRRGDKTQLIFSGSIKIEKGNDYQALINAQTGQLFLTPVSSLNAIPPVSQATEAPNVSTEDNTDDQADQENIVNQQNNSNAATDSSSEPSSATPELSPGMQMLQTQMSGEVVDKNKLEKAMEYIGQVRSLTSQEATQICSWLLFDENRLKFVKAAYPKISDPENLSILRSTFTEAASKATFEKFLKSK